MLAKLSLLSDAYFRYEETIQQSLPQLCYCSRGSLKLETFRIATNKQTTSLPFQPHFSQTIFLPSTLSRQSTHFLHTLILSLNNLQMPRHQNGTPWQEHHGGLSKGSRRRAGEEPRSSSFHPGEIARRREEEPNDWFQMGRRHPAPSLSRESQQRRLHHQIPSTGKAAEATSSQVEGPSDLVIRTPLDIPHGIVNRATSHGIEQLLYGFNLWPTDQSKWAGPRATLE